MINISNVSVKNIKNTVNTKSIKNVEANNKNNFKNILNKSKKEEKHSDDSVIEAKCNNNAEYEKKMEKVNDKIDKNNTKNNTNNNICKETKGNTKTNVERKEVYDEILALLNEMGLKKYCVVLDDKAGDKYKIKLLDLIKNNNEEIKNMIMNSLKGQEVIDVKVAKKLSTDIINKLVYMLNDIDVKDDTLKKLFNGSNDTNDILNNIDVKDDTLKKLFNSSNDSNDLINKIVSILKEKTNQYDKVGIVGTDKRNDLLLDSDKKHETDKFLKCIIDDDKKSNNIQKTVNFMNQFKTFELGDSGAVKHAKSIVINKNNFVYDVVKSVKFMNDNGLKNLSVKIMPKELGEIMIKVTMDSGVMKAQISASNKETFNLLNANMQNITDKINSSDIRIENIDINLNNDGSNFFNKQPSNGGESRQDNKNSINIIDMDLNNDEIMDTGSKYFQGNVNAFV